MYPENKSIEFIKDSYFYIIYYSLSVTYMNIFGYYQLCAYYISIFYYLSVYFLTSETEMT